jgi:hypothetical protein
VASKRFPLSDEWLARFRFARVFFSRDAAGRDGQFRSENLRNRLSEARE